MIALIGVFLAMYHSDTITLKSELYLVQGKDKHVKLTFEEQW